MKGFVLQSNSKRTWREASGINGNLETAKDNTDLRHPERCYKENYNIKVSVLLTSLLGVGDGECVKSQDKG